MNNLSKRHQLWLNLSTAIADNNEQIFEIFRQRMLYSDISVVNTIPSGFPESFRIIFPSNKEWQNKIYLKLVEKQRKHDAAGEKQEE